MKFFLPVLVSATLTVAQVSLYNDDVTFTALHSFSASARPLRLATNLKRESCPGTCVQCYGAGYIECPGSNVCYKPGDSLYGLASCTGGSSTTSNARTCATEYGPTWVVCPYDANSCYDTTTSTASSACYGTTTTDTCRGKGGCAACFGAGFIPCLDDDRSCYNPSNSTTCCPSVCASGTNAGGTSTSRLPRTTSTTVQAQSQTTKVTSTSSLPVTLPAVQSSSSASRATTSATQSTSSVPTGGAARRVVMHEDVWDRIVTMLTLGCGLLAYF